MAKTKYNVVAKYSYDEYPGQPERFGLFNSGFSQCRRSSFSNDATLGTCYLPLQNACYPADRIHSDQVTPWIEAFVNARKWVEDKMK